MTKKYNMTHESFISMIEDERIGGRDVCSVISKLLLDNNYADGFEYGCVERLFKDSYDNNLLSREELRHFSFYCIRVLLRTSSCEMTLYQ